MAFVAGIGKIAPMPANLPFRIGAALCAAAVSFIAGTGSIAAGELQRAFYRDRWVSYVERDGLAITEGDIVLGPAAALAQQRHGPLPLKALIVDDQSVLWPVGTSGAHEVPFTYEAGPEANINAAIAQFNALFPGIIQWVPRAAQPDYVAFNLVGPPGSCFSGIGRTGGRQTIGGTTTCSVGALLHEMGHAVGFWHTQADAAQGSFLDIRYAAMDPRWIAQYTPQFDARQVGGFDYASIMHYGPFVESQTPDPMTTATRPFGIDIGLRVSYSEADVDAIRRLYGGAPSTVTVTSNPPGLQVLVDGVPQTTPVVLPWRLGSLHRLDVPAEPQALGTARYAFGRWGHDSRAAPAAAQEVIVEPGQGTFSEPLTRPRTSVLSANFVRLLQVSPLVSGSENGSLTVTPDLPPWPGTSDWYPQFTKLSYAADVAPGFLHTWLSAPTFLSLSGGGGGAASAERRIGASGPVLAGGAIFFAPAIVLQAAGPGVDGSLRANVTSPGATSPVSTLVPNVLQSGSPGGIYTIAVDATQTRSDSVRFQLQSIDGLDDGTSKVALPLAGEVTKVVTINVQKQYQAFIERHPICGGFVGVSGGAWISHGTTVQATASSLPAGVVFAGWGGTMTGSGTTSDPLSVDRAPHAIAYFNTIAEPLRLTAVSPTTFTLGQGPRTFRFTGSGFTAGTFASNQGGAQKSGTLIDSRTFEVTLDDADFAHPGRNLLLVGTPLTADCNALSDEVAIDVAPAIAPQRVTVHEFYNATLDRYFRTASDAEAAAIRANPATGEADTGQPIKAWSGVAYPEGARPVFRFYGSVAPGPNSHFFTVDVDEARSLQRAELDTPASVKRWNYEELSFAIRPAANGGCPALAPVRIYRVYNDGFARGKDSNHRLLTDFGLYAQMLAQGWIGEGVVMCGPA
jgi:hypothetical protein